MKLLLTLLLLLVATLGLTGCASKPADRIAADRATFESWPPAVQQQIAAGKVAVGFTEAQVRMAMGDPARMMTRTVEDGQRTIWEYAASKPGFSLGLGVGSGGGGSSVGGGIGIGSGSRSELISRVEFADGVVESIEQAAID